MSSSYFLAFSTALLLGITASQAMAYSGNSFDVLNPTPKAADYFGNLLGARPQPAQPAPSELNTPPDLRKSEKCMRLESDYRAAENELNALKDTIIELKGQLMNTKDQAQILLIKEKILQVENLVLIAESHLHNVGIAYGKCIGTIGDA